MRSFLIFLFFAIPALLMAQETPSAPAKKLTVLVKPAKPFAFEKGRTGGL